MMTVMRRGEGGLSPHFSTGESESRRSKTGGILNTAGEGESHKAGSVTLSGTMPDGERDESTACA